MISDFKRAIASVDRNLEILSDLYESISCRLRSGLEKMAADMMLSIENVKSRCEKKAAEIDVKKCEGAVHQNMAITLASYEADLVRRESITTKIENQIHQLDNCSSIENMEITLSNTMSVFESVILLLTPSWKKMLIFTIQTNLRHQPFLVASLLIDAPLKSRYTDATRYIRGQIEGAGITVVGTTQDGAMPIINTTSSGRPTLMTEVWRQEGKKLESALSELPNIVEKRLCIRTMVVDNSELYMRSSSYQLFEQSTKLRFFNSMGSLLSPTIKALLVTRESGEPSLLHTSMKTFALAKLSDQSAFLFNDLLGGVLGNFDSLEEKIRDTFEGICFEDSSQGMRNKPNTFPGQMNGLRFFEVAAASAFLDLKSFKLGEAKILLQRLLVNARVLGLADDTEDPADFFHNIFQPEKHPTVPNLHVVGMVDYEHKFKNLFELVSRYGFPGIPANAFWDMAEDPVMAGKFSTGWFGRDIHRVKQSYHLVSKDCEEYFELKGNTEAALFCRVFRQLIRACDEKGNSREARLGFFKEFQEYFDSKVFIERFLTI
jgi:hypothetical protein